MWNVKNVIKISEVVKESLGYLIRHITSKRYHTKSDQKRAQGAKNTKKQRSRSKEPFPADDVSEKRAKLAKNSDLK